MTTTWHEMTALALGRGIADGTIDPVALAEHFLTRIAEHDPQRRIYITPMPERARAEAEAARARARAGLRRGPLDGVPMSWKDLTDSAGTPTTFASELFRERVPDRDALLLARASRQGMVCLGKTNLSEFAYSGLGINPVYGTPANAADPKVARIPGGSSSGAAVSVAGGLAPAAIGSDTGGSVRIPAALNGVVGLKTTHGLLPLDGIMALSPSLDTIGPLTRDVADANAVLSVLDGAPAADLAGASLAGRHLLRPTTLAFDALEPAVESACARAIDALAAAGARISDAPVPEFAEAFDIVAAHGNIISAQACAIWRDEIERDGEKIYRGVRARLDLAKSLSAVDAERAHLLLADCARRCQARMAGFDGIVLPSVPMLAPPIADLEDDAAAFDRTNLAITRNTRLGNVIGLCAISLPCQAPGDLPVGLMIMARPNREGALLRLAKAVEAALAGGAMAP